jgi:hypothetical protein
MWRYSDRKSVTIEFVASIRALLERLCRSKAASSDMSSPADFEEEQGRLTTDTCLA